MIKLKRRWIAVATRVMLGGLLLLIGLGVFIWLVVVQPEPARRAEEPPRAEVVVFHAQTHEVARQWRGFGTANAMRTADIPARLNATIERLPDGIDPGQPVQQGALIAQLDPTDFEQELEAALSRIEEIDAMFQQAQAQYERLEEARELEIQEVQAAERQLARARELIERDIIAEEDLDQALRQLITARRSLVATEESLAQFPARDRQLRAQRRAQQAAVQQAQLNLERTQITSPIAGVLEEVDVRIGENVQPGQRVARVVSLERIEVPLHLPASARVWIDLGDDVMLEATDGSQRQWSGPIARIAPADDANSQTLRVYIELDQGEPAPGQQRGLLNPGTFVEGRIQSNDVQQRWIVPRRAIRDGAIRVVDQDRVRSVPVRIAWTFEGQVQGFGLPDDRQWAVLADDLEPGMAVLVDAAAAVLDGQRVQVSIAGQDADAPEPVEEVAR